MPSRRYIESVLQLFWLVLLLLLMLLMLLCFVMYNSVHWQSGKTQRYNCSVGLFRSDWVCILFPFAKMKTTATMVAASMRLCCANFEPFSNGRRMATLNTLHWDWTPRTMNWRKRRSCHRNNQQTTEAIVFRTRRLQAIFSEEISYRNEIVRSSIQIETIHFRCGWMRAGFLWWWWGWMNEWVGRDRD